jgi:hypothetical protein
MSTGFDSPFCVAGDAPIVRVPQANSLSCTANAGLDLARMSIERLRIADLAMEVSDGIVTFRVETMEQLRRLLAVRRTLEATGVCVSVRTSNGEIKNMLRSGRYSAGAPAPAQQVVGHRPGVMVEGTPRLTVQSSTPGTTVVVGARERQAVEFLEHSAQGLTRNRWDHAPVHERPVAVKTIAPSGVDIQSLAASLQRGQSARLEIQNMEIIDDNTLRQLFWLKQKFKGQLTLSARVPRDASPEVTQMIQERWKRAEAESRAILGLPQMTPVPAQQRPAAQRNWLHSARSAVSNTARGWWQKARGWLGSDGSVTEVQAA